MKMRKAELIAAIQELNKSAKPEFLEVFTEQELSDYLENLMELDLERKPKCKDENSSKIS